MQEREWLEYQGTNSNDDWHIDRRYYRNCNYRSNYHAHLELVYVYSGELQATVDGVQMTIGPGRFCLILPWQVHSFLSLRPSKSVVFVFSGKYIRQFIQENESFQGGYQTFRADERIRSLFLEALCDSKDIERNSFCGVMYLLCHCFLEQFHRKEQTESPDSVVQQGARITTPVGHSVSMMNYISAHCCERLSLKSTAKALGYSYHYLSHVFKKHTGLSFQQFLATKRLEKAMDMLLQTGFPIAEIAWRCGFSSIRTFDRQFAAMNGITPNEYRSSRLEVGEQIRLDDPEPVLPRAILMEKPESWDEE